MLRKLAIAIAASGAMSAAQVYALGLGEIELDSALNQPLDARIKLVKASELENWEIKPSLASAGEFEQAGVERVFFLNGMKFEVERIGKDVYINLSTQQPVVEPFLNFLVQVDWPNGRLLREYTLLLDPPVFNEAQPAKPVQAPAQVSEEPELPGVGVAEPAPAPAMPVAQEPTYEPEPAPVEVEEDMTEAEPEARTYAVTPNDTLWEIALEVRPDRAISPQQVMLAIQDENPTAFIRGNINRLKKNQVLRIPTEEQMRSRSFRQSVAEVAMQNDQMAQRKAQLDATRKSQITQRDDQLPEAQLKLLTDGEASTDADRKAGGQVSDRTAGDQSKLDQELSLALENLDKANLENQELRARLDAMEEQLNTLQRLINLKDEQMVALQAGMSGVTTPAADMTDKVEGAASEPLNAAASGEGAVSADAQTVEETSEGTPDLNFAEQQTEAPVEQPVADASTTDAEKAVPPAKPFQPLPAPAPKGPMDFVMENLPLIAGGLGAILVALLGIRALRNRKAENDSEKESAFVNDTMQDLADHPMDGNSESLDDDFADLELGDELGSDIEQDGLAELEGDAFEMASDADLPDALDEHHESSDVLGEAEMYIAYGRLDRARDLLESTLASEPSRMELRMKLLEVLSEQDDAPSFAEHYSEAMAQVDESQQAEADRLRGNLTNADAVGSAGELADSDLSDGEELDFSEFESDNLGLSEEAADADLSDGNQDLDFDLDGLEMDAGNGGDELADASDTEFENSLDFELNLDSDLDNTDELASGLDETPLELNEDDGDLSLDFDMGDDTVELETSSDLDGELESDLGDDLNLELDDELPTLADNGTLEGDDFAELSLEDEELPTLESGDEDLSLTLDGELDSELELDGDLDSELESSFAGDEELDLDLGFEEELDDADELSLEGDDGLAELDALSAELGDDEIELDLDGDGADQDLSLAELEAELDSDVEVASEEVPELTLDVELDEEQGDDLTLASADVAVPELTPELSLDDEQPVVQSAVEADQLAATDAPATEAAGEEELSLDGLDDDLDFLSGTDESETKLDLARAYIDMDDKDGAREILSEVLEEGNDEQRKEATKLMDSLS